MSFLQNIMEALESMSHPKIMVDGELRHVNNSNGQPIHDTHEGLMNFHRWFGKSKAVDQHGRPSVYYHGTGTDFDSFSHKFAGKGEDAHGAGFYFTNNPTTAGHYARTHIMPVYLKIHKPIDRDSDAALTEKQIHGIITRAPDLDSSLQNFGDVSHEGMRSVLKSAVDAYTDTPKFQAMNMLHNDFYRGHHEKFLDAFKTATGHDGVVVNHETSPIAVAFHPSQIKSATGNNGEYNKKSSKLTESDQNGISSSISSNTTGSKDGAT